MVRIREFIILRFIRIRHRPQCIRQIVRLRKIDDIILSYGYIDGIGHKAIRKIISNCCIHFYPRSTRSITCSLDNDSLRFISVSISRFVGRILGYRPFGLVKRILGYSTYSLIVGSTIRSSACDHSFSIQVICHTCNPILTFCKHRRRQKHYNHAQCKKQRQYHSFSFYHIHSGTFSFLNNRVVSSCECALMIT